MGIYLFFETVIALATLDPFEKICYIFISISFFPV